METIKNLSDFIKNNGLLWGFQCGSASIINNFLHDTTNETTKQKYVDIDIDAAMADLFAGSTLGNGKKNKHEKIIIDMVIYHPINQNFINKLIELDELFRASTILNTQPLTVFRGAPTLTKDALSGIISTSLSVDIAAEFYKGSLLKINLPSNFPALNLYDNLDDTFSVEKEIILPPCDYEIASTFTLPHTDFPEKFPNYYKCYEINVTPKNLAECVLNRMKNPPKDYFDFLTQSDKTEFKKALKLLKTYVKDYVKTDKYKVLTILNQKQPNNE